MNVWLALITTVAAQLGMVIQRKRAEEDRKRLLIQLQEAMAEVKLHSGFLRVCACCKRICDDNGRWQQMEIYSRDHSEAEFSHGVCPDYARKFYPEYYNP